MHVLEHHLPLALWHPKIPLRCMWSPPLAPMDIPLIPLEAKFHDTGLPLPACLFFAPKPIILRRLLHTEWRVNELQPNEEIISSVDITLAIPKLTPCETPQNLLRASDLFYHSPHLDFSCFLHSIRNSRNRVLLPFLNLNFKIIVLPPRYIV